MRTAPSLIAFASASLVSACVVPWSGEDDGAAGPSVSGPSVVDPGGDDDAVPDTDRWEPLDTAGEPPDEPVVPQWSTGDVPMPTCADAEAMAPVQPGAYVGDFLGLELASGEKASCIPFSTRGPVGFLKVAVPAGNDLVVQLEASVGDTQLAVLADCNALGSASCLVGADATVSGTEVVTWTNQSASDAVVYLRLSTFSETGASAAYDLSVDIY
jgi:hypothetical protein